MRSLFAKPSIWIFGGLVLVAALVALLLRPTPPSTTAGELVVFCAAGLLPPVQEIATAYEKEYGVKIQLEPDSSGALLTKLRVAADRVDLYLAGEESFIIQARRQGLIAEALPVARQHVVIAVAAGNPKSITSVADLLNDNLRVVLPNPELTAVGKVLGRALDDSTPWKSLVERTKASGSRVALVGTVNEAAQAVKLQAADAALIWDATARQFGLGLVEVPALRQHAAEQATVGVVTASKKPTAALHFARFLTARDRGQLILARHLLQPLADADTWQDRPDLVLMSGAMLKPAVDELLNRFQAREGCEITRIYAGCGIHVAQMKAMKKGDLAASRFPDAYFACDVSFMDMVQPWFEASQRISRNDMVIAVAKGNPKGVRSIQDLTRLDLRLGLAHPVNSALGALTDDLLKKLGLHAEVYAAQRKLPVVHSDAGHMLVNQLRTGALDLTVVYRSNVLSHSENAREHLDIVEMNLPEAVAIQPFAVAQDSSHKYIMRRLLEALLAPGSHKHFVDSGFQWVADQPAP